MEEIDKQLKSLVQEQITPQLGFFVSKHCRVTGMGGNNSQKAYQRNQLGWRNGELTHPIRGDK
ncbi:MAG: hypothetical protein MK289_01730 [Trichodesmium sp. ALOHA_ZT_67]|nr:hypothetical protein [Trichodesmium erythraeum GBRTRLIN201]MCH2047257.1 hypothetical protein [Trichodesmium sp. ALOHA_ZT_67]MDE5095568.1 hypothetical protein [Trichodesmium sp. St11_bin5]MDT9340470.1 hypothetical protein [Trichodesmium erythraeum 21-75]